ncbi:uncharacterized protein LOC119556574 [Drosophila subpulchrella]|uniref:uncharacterized protein LOC119556574 n=1 Tax=Drosophila subpulchrella TaxID=1486046 RepID=UPI0018A1A450|nr:uncharacterized protein LOC119556574 [Drosophila subpulchrella]
MIFINLKEPIQNPTLKLKAYRKTMSEILEDLKESEETGDEDTILVGNPRDEESPGEETPCEELRESDRGLMNIGESTELTESTESSDFFYKSMDMPLERTFPLGKPHDLRVGNFEEVLDLIGTSDTNIGLRQVPKISIDKMAQNLDPENTIGQKLDGRWHDSLGPERVLIAEQLLISFQKNLSPTLIVVVEEHQFHCHAMVLQVLSSFFRRPKLARSQVFQLPSSMVSARAFVTMYRWALEESNRMGPGLLMQVFRAARFFGCQELIGNCWRGIDQGSLVPDRALSLYICSRVMGLRLEEGLLSRLGSNFLQFIASKEFLSVEAGTVRRLLGLSSLAVNSEMEVYLAAIIWLDHKWPQRKHFALNMMQAVRFDLLPFMFLLTLVKRVKDGPPVMRMLANTRMIRKRALKALDDVKESKSRYQGRCGNGTRTWIYDRRAPHHHGSDCRRAHYVDYNSFVRYVTWLQTAGAKHWLTLRMIDDPDVRCCPLHRRR